MVPALTASLPQTQPSMTYPVAFLTGPSSERMSYSLPSSDYSSESDAGSEILVDSMVLELSGDETSTQENASVSINLFYLFP